MAAKLKNDGDGPGSVFTVSRETFARMIEACENPPKPTRALRALMAGAPPISQPKR